MGAEAARKLLYLANQNITKNWTMPMQNWANILNHTQFCLRTTVFKEPKLSFSNNHQFS
jgi:transposase-like protein